MMGEIKPWGYIHHSATRTLCDRALCNSTITKKATANSGMPLYTAAELGEAVAAERKRCAKIITKEIGDLCFDKRQFIKKGEVRSYLKLIRDDIRSTTK